MRAERGDSSAGPHGWSPPIAPRRPGPNAQTAIKPSRVEHVGLRAIGVGCWPFATPRRPSTTSDCPCAWSDLSR
jgi:hypothetical protein